MARYDTEGSGALTDGSYRASGDPYAGMEKAETRPKLGVIEGGGTGDGGERPDPKVLKGGKAEGARENLANSERGAAASGASVTEGGAGQAKAAEQNQAYGPRYTGVGLPDDKKGTPGQAQGIWRKRGPLVVIMTILIGGGGLAAGGVLTAPVAVVQRIIQEFNSMKVVMSESADVNLKFQLDGERYRNPTRKTFLGNDKFKIKPGGKQAVKLAMEGIDVVETDVNGKRLRLLLFDDGSGVRRPILTDTDYRTFGSVADQNAIIGRLRADMPGVDFDVGTSSLSGAFEMDGFRNGYLKASKTWKGNVAGWFDSLVLKIFDRLNISRSRFKRWQTASDIEAGNAEFRRVAAAAGDAAETDRGTRVEGLEDDPDVEGDDATRTRVESDASQDRIAATDTPEVAANKLSAKARAALNVVQDGTGLVNVKCAIMSAAGAVNAVAVAAEVAQVLNYVTGFLEAVQKMQAGDGANSPLAYYMNALMTPDVDGKTGMGAQGMGSLFGRKTIDVNSESNRKYNLENGVTLLGQELQYDINDMMGCSYARFAAAPVEGAADVVMLVGTFGVGNLVKSFTKMMINTGLQIVIEAAVSKLVSLVIPQLAGMITRDLIGGAVGEDLGTAVRVGANMYLGKNHQGGGGSPGDQETVLAYKRATEAVLAEEAEYDRAMRSPFDVRSPNTFLGSLMHSLVPMASSTSGVGIVSSLGSLMSNSLVSLLPTAGALGQTRMITQQGDCPTLKAVKIMGDDYCVPYFTSDLSTIGLDPGEGVFEKVVTLKAKENYVTRNGPISAGEGNSCRVGNEVTGYSWVYSMANNFKTLLGAGGRPVNDDNPAGCAIDIEVDTYENPVINLDSELGKYIVLCGQRESPFGVADANITAALKLSTGNNTLDEIISSGLGAIPVGSALSDVADAAQDVANAVWIGGAVCSASDENPRWNDDMKYYQRYVELQRLFEESGIIEKSAVTVMLEEYYEKNPIDQSYEGVLARYSGLSKDQVIATLDLVDYANFIAEYDPSGLAPMAVEEEVSLAEQVPDGVIADHADVPVVQWVVYNDVRNRSFAV